MPPVPGDGQSVMAGHGYYSRHSQPQRAAARSVDGWLVAAAGSVPIPEPPTPLLIGDFGCAGGVNEMAPLAAAVDAVRARSRSVPVEVAHTDLPANDFAPLFTLLSGPDGYPAGRSGVYPYVVGRTLYGPLFPDRRLHLGWSAITLHWLSEMPVVVPGQVYANLIPDGPERTAVQDRSAADWRTFLLERSRELVVGGELVLVAGASEPDGTSGAEGLFAMIERELEVMLDEGILRPGESDRIFYPTWNRTPEEWLAPVEALGFDVVDSGLSATDDAHTYGGVEDGAAFAAAYLPFVRAVTELPFFRWLDEDRGSAQRAEVVESFYAGLADRISREPDVAACRWHVMALRLRSHGRSAGD